MASLATAALVLLLCHAYICRAIMVDDFFRSLLSDYNKDTPPDTKPVLVRYALYVKSIEVDEVKGHLSLIAVVVSRWKDERIVWKGVSVPFTTVQFPIHTVWVPDIVMLSAIKPETAIIAPSKVDVDDDGSVKMSKQFGVTALCNLTIVQDNTYTCNLEFASWVYWLSDVDLQPLNEDSILYEYTESGNWLVRNVTVTRKETHYAPGSHVSLVYTLQLEKTTTLAEQSPAEEVEEDTGVKVSALPIVFLGFMAPFQFLIPLQSAERITFDGFLLLTGTVIAVALYDISPAAQLPKSVTSYCNYVLTLVFLCLILTFINLHICTSLGKRLPVLNFLKKGLFSGANRLVFVAVPKLRDVRVKRPRVVIEHRMDDLSKDDPTPETTPDVPETGGREREQLTEIADILIPLAEDRVRCENEARIRYEWLTVGLIIDRLLFVLFVLVFAFCSLGFIP